MKSEKYLPRVKKNVLLRNYTTFKIGGRAKYFFEARTKKDLILAIKMAKKFNLPFFLLGGGSKLLVADEGFKGLVIKVQNSRLRLGLGGQVKLNTVYTQAGVMLSDLVKLSFNKSLTGLEWAVGIPGATIGGAIIGNAGAFGKSIKDVIKEVEVFDSKDLKIKTYNSKDCKFNYRDSIFKKNLNLIILSAKIQLKKEKKSEIENKMKEYLAHRKDTQPLNFPSAGSIFKNPSGFTASELIEKCGLKGKRIGDVEISKKHANFIINLGNGRAEDVRKLINLVKNRVKNKFGIKLQEEIQYIGF